MTLRQLAVLAAVAFAILSPVVQAAGQVGLSASEFASQGDETLRAADYAFSIWSVIYLGLAVFAVWQALPRNRNDSALDAARWPAVAAFTGVGLWIWASAANARWATVAIIVLSAAAAILAIWRFAQGSRSDWRARALVESPIALLAGWLSLAAVINIVTVLTAEGLVSPGSLPIAMAGIVVATLAALATLRAVGAPAYGVPVAWGLVAVWVAERNEKPVVAMAAMLAAALVAVMTVWLARAQSRLAYAARRS